MRWGKERKRRFLVWLVAFLAAVILPGPWAEGGEKEASAGELLRVSDAVVWAEITGIRSGKWQTAAGSLPVIFYDARVKKVLSGSAPANVAVMIPGFMAEGRILMSPDVLYFRPGQEGIFFLQKPGGTGQKEFSLADVSAGFFAVAVPEKGAEPLVRVPAGPTAHHPAAMVWVRLSDFASLLQAAKENQAQAGAGQ